MLTDAEVRARYGPGARISRKGSFVLVHLDDPDDDLLKRRTDAFDPDAWFDPRCPLCQLQRSRGVFVFDSDPTDRDPTDGDEWVFLD